MSDSDSLNCDTAQLLVEKVKLHYYIRSSDPSEQVNELKKIRQKRYREQNREKLKQREVERRKRKKLQITSEPSMSSSVNRIELSNEETCDANSQSSSGLEGAQTLSFQENQQAEEKNALEKKRERQRRYREQNREKLKQREAERRQRLQNSYNAESSTSSNIDCIEMICEAVIDDQELSTKSLTAAGLEGTETLFVEITERFERKAENSSFISPYEQHRECAMPHALLRQDADIPGDGNCFFYSVIKVLQLDITPQDLRKQLCGSVHLHSCTDPSTARSILLSDFEYADYNCIFIFSREYNINVCIHFHYFNVNNDEEEVSFCHYKVNTTEKFIHLHLINQHFTPYIETERTLLENETVCQQMLHLPETCFDVQIDDETYRSNNSDVNEAVMESDEYSIPIYKNHNEHSSNLDIDKTFAHSCGVCGRLCRKNDLKTTSIHHDDILRLIIPNYVSGNTVNVCPSCKKSLDKDRVPLLSDDKGCSYPVIPSHVGTFNLLEQQLTSPEKPFRQKRFKHVIIKVPVEVNAKQQVRSCNDDASDNIFKMDNEGVQVGSVIKQELEDLNSLTSYDGGASKVELELEEIKIHEPGGDVSRVFIKIESEDVDMRSAIKQEPLEDINSSCSHTSYDGGQIGELESEEVKNTHDSSLGGDVTSVQVKIEKEDVDMNSVIKQEPFEDLNSHYSHTSYDGEESKVELELEEVKDIPKGTGDADIKSVNMMNIFKIEDEGVQMRSDGGFTRDENLPLGSLYVEHTQKDAAGETTMLNDYNNILTKALHKPLQTKNATICTKLRKPRGLNSENQSSVLICDQCNCKFRSQLLFSRHIAKHNSVNLRKNNGSLRQSALNSETTLKSPLVAHPQSDKVNENIHNVPAILTRTNVTISRQNLKNNCEQSSTESSDLTLHTETHTDKKSYSCDQCKLSFNTSGNLKAHIKTHTNETPFSCNDCSKCFKKLSYLTKHMRETHSSLKPYSCSKCSKSFTRISSLTIHMRTHTGERPYLCNYCNKRFTQHANLTKHMRSHTGEKPYTCNQCDIQFTKSEDLTSHMRTHADVDPYFCRLCNIYFTEVALYAKHMRTHGQKPFLCNQCQKGFENISSLKSHMRTHTGEKPFPCSHCCKSFSQISSLTRHKRTHTGEKPYSCNQCEMGFTSSGELTRHMRTHTGEKPYSCYHCEKSFTRKDDLIIHVRTHTGEKPYPCSQCEKCFTSSGNLTSHMKSHTGE